MNPEVKILIVEDEPLIADDIAFILEDEGYKITGKAVDTKEAIEILENKKPDIVLLDISFDGDDEDGIDLANIINEKYKIPFIFITSYSDKLTINRVKKTGPAGFIVKPFTASEIISTIAIVHYKTGKKEDFAHDKKGDSFFIKVGHDLVKIKFDDIFYIKAEDNYTSLVKEEESILASISMKALSEKLPENQFVRIHRSYMVNIAKITRISHRFVYLGKHEVPIGRNHYQKLQEFITTL
jgi:DNA-binding LytR/AlgR family response regulator